MLKRYPLPCLLFLTLTFSTFAALSTDVANAQEAPPDSTQITQVFIPLVSAEQSSTPVSEESQDGECEIKVEQRAQDRETAANETRSLDEVQDAVALLESQGYNQMTEGVSTLSIQCGGSEIQTTTIPFIANQYTGDESTMYLTSWQGVWNEKQTEGFIVAQGSKLYTLEEGGLEEAVISDLPQSEQIGVSVLQLVSGPVPYNAADGRMLVKVESNLQDAEVQPSAAQATFTCKTVDASRPAYSASGALQYKFHVVKYWCYDSTNLGLQSRWNSYYYLSDLSTNNTSGVANFEELLSESDGYISAGHSTLRQAKMKVCIRSFWS